MTKPTKNNHDRMSPEKRRAIVASLETLLVKDGDSYRYVDGWSDKRVAADERMAEETIAHTRKMFFGRLIAPNNLTSRQQFEDRISKLETIVAGLTRTVADLQPGSPTPAPRTIPILSSTTNGSSPSTYR